MSSLAAAGIGGCLAGCIAGAAGMAVQQNKHADSTTNGKTGGHDKLGPMAMSPSRFMSPPTHLRRDTPSSAPQPKVDAGVSLTNKMADFRKVGEMAQELDVQPFVDLLTKLIGESKYLQNNPRLGIFAQEKRAADICVNDLKQFSTENGGPLIIEELEYKPGRSNLKITYPGTSKKTLSFVGSHFDVVPADPETWDKDPFKLTQDGDKLYGRGTTDCLGHVALLTRFIYELAKARPILKRNIICLFIAGEEGGEADVGVDLVVASGKLDEAKNGPVYWIDSADSQPCCGSSSALGWSITCHGRVFHSGFPQKGINSIEMAGEVISQIQQRFYEDFPPHANEDAYQFSCGSNMKPTQIECAKGSFNQICPTCTVSGDIRLSPFYDVEDVVQTVEQYVKDLNDYIDEIPTKGSWSKFKLPESVTTQPGELRRGRIELKWQGDLDTFKLYAGIAVNLKSEGHKAIVQACRETYASVKPFSVNGSLPLVNMMQQKGFDIQICGFGLMSVYHGVNEYCTISEMSKAYEVLLRIICLLESNI